MNLDANSRKAMIEDFLNDKTNGQFKARKNRALSAEEQLFVKAVKAWQDVENQTVRPLLKALPTAAQYNTEGTMRLVKDAFISKFATWNKEELLFLVTIMHTEEMTKKITEMVNQGMVGPDMDKPI